MMSTNVTGKTGVIIDLRNINDLQLSDVVDELNIDTNIKWSFGELAKQVEVLYHDKISVPQNDEVTLNLYSSSNGLVDAFGAPLTMKAIKFLYVKNTSDALTVSVFGGGSLDLLIMSGMVNSIVLPPEAFMLWACPTAAGIVTTNNYNLKLAASADTDPALVEVVALGLV